MKRTLTLLAFVVSLSAVAFADDTWVKSYTRKDGTQVEGHARSRPNAYKWDNKSYTPDQPAYNDSYTKPTKSYGSEWTKPSETRFQDSNPYNDNPPANTNSNDWLNSR
jgi:hypothetical protein